MENAHASDVERLRGIIETLNKDINYYGKDFQYKKQQFLESKKFMETLHLRRKNLTMHLHTIIASNEQKKSDQMSDLMMSLKKMEVKNDFDGNIDDDDRKNVNKNVNMGGIVSKTQESGENK